MWSGGPVPLHVTWSTKYLWKSRSFSCGRWCLPCWRRWGLCLLHCTKTLILQYLRQAWPKTFNYSLNVIIRHPSYGLFVEQSCDSASQSLSQSQHFRNISQNVHFWQLCLQRATLHVISMRNGFGTCTSVLFWRFLEEQVFSTYVFQAVQHVEFQVTHVQIYNLYLPHRRLYIRNFSTHL